MIQKMPLNKQGTNPKPMPLPKEFPSKGSAKEMPFVENCPQSNATSGEVPFDENPILKESADEIPFDEDPISEGISKEVPFDEDFSVASEVPTPSDEALCRMAIAAMANAYVPYSGYQVGAALLCKNGSLFTGCNIENASYTPTVCAERTAIFKAVSEGVREFQKIAVCGGKEGVISGAFPPCGVCRQVMAEFCDEHFEILVVTSADPIAYRTYTLKELLPEAFSPIYLK